MSQIELLKKYGLAIRGWRGQHLLVDENIQRKMVEAVRPIPGETLLEIGPGLGALTERFLKVGARVIAVESDSRFVRILNGEFGRNFDKLKIIQGDVLKLDLASLVKANVKLRVFGNIPYYITTPILLRLIRHRAVIDSAFLTMQREVADRILAQAGSKNYGRLSLLARFYADAKRRFNVSRSCFSPKPKVDSAFIELKFRAQPLTSVREDILFALIKAGFGGRRKNLLNAVFHGFGRDKGVRISKGQMKEIFDRAGVSPAARAEDLMLKDFIRLAGEFAASLDCVTQQGNSTDEASIKKGEEGNSRRMDASSV